MRAPLDQPNIIFILADDLGYADTGYTGQKHIQTPNLDAMARDGIQFTRAYTGAPVCAPSRCTLLTGKHTGHARIRGNGVYQLRESPDDPCIGDVLKAAGYTTALIGKSGLSGNIDDGGHPNRKGFDHFVGFVSHAAAHRHYPVTMYKNGRELPLPGNAGKEGSTYDNTIFLKESLRFIRENASKPFFLHIAPTIPHADLAAPDQFINIYRGKFNEEQAAAGAYRKTAEPKATYAAMVTYLDHMVGEVLATLRDAGIAKNTLVLFASDNGAMQEGGYLRKWFQSSGDLRGGKRDIYDGGIRTAQLAWWPGVIRGGSSSDIATAFWDFLPTACAVAGAPVPPGIDGISIAPTLNGRYGKQKHHAVLYWEFHEMGGRRGVLLDGRWKAVQYDVNSAKQGVVEVYDTRLDPSEKRDIAQERPDLVDAAKRAFTAERVADPEYPFKA
jgi:arylsulfatase A-like enzyme